ncbi:putative 6-hexanolide hydrolase [Corynebacterium kutscheri]|uniref:alpha/beta hydrolase n=1 Tax=Corynebacterium kutscheri TaxID=35755 RepID=UPI000F70BE00|nr:alpha/beta fold hydrolase [Corynebacterium kutscheri]VEH80248.1 putative 6-hexanolide hydrolase [Corynebacterium kutscheri]
MNRYDISYSLSGREEKGTIVALHGITDNGASLSDIAAQWKNEWKVVLLDTLGHGLSRSFTKEELTNPFDAIVHAMSQTIVEIARTTTSRKVVLIGHSLGGAVAAHIARAYPELIEALILEDPALLTVELQQLYYDDAATLVNRQELVTAHVGEAIAELMKVYRHWPASEYGAWAQGKTQVDRNFIATGVVGSLGRSILNELSTPTLLITGDGADVLFGADGLTEVENLANPFLSSSLIPQATHTVRRDQPEAFYDLVESFLHQHCKGHRRAPLYIAEELREIVEKTPEQITDNIPAMRERAEKLLGHVKPEPGIELKIVTLENNSAKEPRNFELRCLKTQGSEPEAIVLSIHGGGYVAGAARYDDERNSTLVHTFGNALVASPDYGLAPENPWPTGAYDCVQALVYLHSHYPDKPLYIYGDSAGAGLARQTIEILHQEGIELCIERLILLEPCLEPQMTTSSFTTYSQGPIWTREASQAAWRHYIGSTPERLPYIPSREVMSCMPPTMIVVNPIDPLRDEGIRLAQDIADAGVPVALHMFPGTFHGALSVKGTATWERVRREIKEFINTSFPATFTHSARKTHDS